MSRNRPQPTGRGGYTLIEMLIVISVAVILMSMSAPAIIAAIRKGAVARAVAAIQEAHDRAQLMSMGERGATNYGVVVVQEANQSPWVGLIKVASGTTGPYRTGSLLTEGGKNVLKTDLGRQLKLWTGTTTLDAAGTEIAWFYQAGTGCPVGMTSSGPTGPADVGTPKRTYTNLYGISGYNVGTNGIAEGSGGAPGLSIRTLDGNFKMAIAIYATGIFTKMDM